MWKLFCTEFYSSAVPTYPRAFFVFQNSGDLMDDLQNYKDAMDKYFEALDIRQNLFGNDHVAVAETFYSMGYTLQNQESYDQALDCFEESLNIRKVQLGLEAKEVGDTLNMMGFLQAKRGELDDALSLLWDALKIRKLQEDHVKVSETLKNIGNVHREKQEHDLAIECYEECLRIRRSELGDGHEKVAVSLLYCLLQCLPHTYCRLESHVYCAVLLHDISQECDFHCLSITNHRML